jgi:hypothetical protein
MTITGKDSAMEASSDYAQIGRFIYATARLEGELAGLLGDMGREGAEDPDLAANASEANVLFSQLTANDEDKAAFAALMQVLAVFGEQRDAIFDRITELPPIELGARIEQIATATEDLRRFRAMITLGLIEKS